MSLLPPKGKASAHVTGCGVRPFDFCIVEIMTFHWVRDGPIVMQPYFTTKKYLKDSKLQDISCKNILIKIYIADNTNKHRKHATWIPKTRHFLHSIKFKRYTHWSTTSMVSRFDYISKMMSVMQSNHVLFGFVYSLKCTYSRKGNSWYWHVTRRQYTVISCRDVPNLVVFVMPFHFAV